MRRILAALAVALLLAVPVAGAEPSPWTRALPAYDGPSAAIAPGPPKLIPYARMGVAAPVQGRFDLIMGSDILYERDEAGTLPAFIEEHAAHACEVWVVDPNRGNRAHFHRNMTGLGFSLSEEKIDRPSDGDGNAYKGRMLTYSRAQ